MEFPDWSDLGTNKLSDTARSLWDIQQTFLLRCEHYYSGRVFEEYVEKEKPTDDDVPLFPAGINLARVFCHAQADAMFGDWKDLPVKFESPGKDGNDTTDGKAIELIHGIMSDSNVGSAFWEADLDRNRYGACVLRASVALSLPNRIRWSKVQRDAFMPIWDPEDPERLLEAWAVTIMSPEQTYLKFGLKTNKERTFYVERWNDDVHQTFLDGATLLDEFNPYRIVPFAYIPRVRTSNCWGDSLIEDIIPIQDELNMTVGDISDVIRKNAHPTVWGRNIPAGFSKDTYKINSDAMLDLGRQVGELVPEIGILEAKANVLAQAFEHLRFLLRMARDHAGTPAIAFGDDDGGGQRSGDTLEIRLRPLEASVRRSRSYFSTGLHGLLTITQAILKQKQFPDVPVRVVDRLNRLVPTYAEILPRDQQAIVDMVVKLLSTEPPSISLETAEIMLGYGTREVDLVKKMLEDKGLWKKNDPAGLSNGAAGPKESQPNKETV